jgi:AcrR family transcriptional regulator
MDLFGQRGFFNTTVEDITEAADVGKGTFFNYFPSKEQVFGVLYEIQLTRVSQARVAAKQGELSLRNLLRHFVHQIAEEPGKNPQLARGLIATVVSSDAVREMHLETMRRGRRILAEVLRLGQRRGEIRRDLAAEDMVRGLQEALIGTVLLWSLNPPSNLEKRLDAIFEIYWAGISLPARKGAESS